MATIAPECSLLVRSRERERARGKVAALSSRICDLNGLRNARVAKPAQVDGEELDFCLVMPLLVGKQKLAEVE